MKRVGITGAEGFLGSALMRRLQWSTDFTVSACPRSCWDHPEELVHWTSQQDVIIHLAGKNRASSPEEIYQVNVALTEKLIEALANQKRAIKVIFSSSIQESRDNEYGQSKKVAREKWHHWAESNGQSFIGLLIPNLFGPFGKPFYNSVVATFCHQVAMGEEPKIQIDAQLPLIHVDDCAWEIIRWIEHDAPINEWVEVQPHFFEKVSDILNLLLEFKHRYMKSGEMPDLDSKWKLYLFATFQSYIQWKEFFPFKLKKNTDARGSFVEVIRLASGGQVSFSTTVPEIVRGNHFHTRKMERFAVIQGKAKIAFRKVDESVVYEFYLNGEDPSFVDMPVWYTHSIENIGEEELLTLFWINEHYNELDPDTYFINVYPE